MKHVLFQRILRGLCLTALLGGALGFLGCDEEFRQNRGHQTYHMPSGWSLASNTQMLARSYPYDQWIALIARLKGEPRHLFSAPYVAPQAPGQRSLFGRRVPRSGRPGPMMPGQKPKKKTQPKAYGFTFWFRCNRAVSLELRLPARSRNAEPSVYRHPLHLKKTGAKMVPVRFLYRDFKPLNSKTSKGRMNPFLIKRIEFWERKAAKHPPSMTLTIRGPILYRSKAAPASKPASRPASRPSSKASLRSTTRPAPQTQPRK